MWLGIQKFLEKPVPFEEIAAKTDFKDASLRGIFCKGIWSRKRIRRACCSCSPSCRNSSTLHGRLVMQYVILTMTLVAMDIVAMGAGYGVLTSRVLALLRDPDPIRWTNRGLEVCL